MSKKAKEVEEAAPKFKQPWQGFLTFATVFILAYLTYIWLLHPVWGLLTKMVQMNAFVAYGIFSIFGMGDLGLLLSLNNPSYMILYPLGYIMNWVSFFVFCIVWFIAIAFLARPFTPSTSRLRKQPLAGIITLVLSVVFAAITWYILGVVFKWKAMEMTLLGTIGFLIFPIWVTLFAYWPFVPKKPGTHSLIRGAIYVTLSWFITFIINWIISIRTWSNSLAVSGTMYFLGYPLEPLTPTEPYYFWISILLGIIVAFSVISQLNLFPNMPQPKRGIVNFIIGVVVGLILWLVITMVLGNSSQTIMSPAGGLITFPYVDHGAVAAYLAFPLLTLLAGQLTFAMWPWARWGTKGTWIWIIAAFIIGTIVFYIVMVSPLGLASSITGANLITSTSGLQTLYLAALASGDALKYWVLLAYFEGLGAYIGKALMASWILSVFIFYLLIYEGFEHWPWK
jgi:hypothetical protein